MNTTVRLVPYYYFFFVLFAFFLLLLLLVWEIRSLKSYSKMCLQKVTGQQEESLYSGLVRYTLGIVAESTNSCYSLGSNKRGSELLPRSRCLQERTGWPRLHQCLQKQEAHCLKSNSVCCQAGRKSFADFNSWSFSSPVVLVGNRIQVFNQFKVHSLYVIIGTVSGNGLTYPSMPKRK